MEAVEPAISQVSEALRVIEDVTETSSKCLVNKHQCNRLADRVNAIAEKLKEPELVGTSKSLDSGTGKVDYPAFDVLLSVLRKGKALVSKYIEAKASIPSLLIRTEDREAFQEIHADLDTMNSQFHFEDFEFSSESKRNAMLTADAVQDLKEISESLDELARTDEIRQAVVLPRNLEQVKLVVSEKSEPGTGDDLPSFLNIDPAIVKIGDPVREPERLSPHGSVETDGWALVRFGMWLGCECALKVFQSDNATWNKSELLKEVEALLKLHHPHIVQLMGFAQDEEKCLSLMELMDTDLRYFMKSRPRQAGKRPFPRAQELEIITQIARGMYYLHEQQYVHGELKCSNILVKQSGDHIDVKVSDLRSSQKLGVSWDPVSFKERSQRRRLRWTAPEVKHYGEREQITPALLKKADVYSFGMVCYEVVTGKLPFQDVRGDALERRIETGVLKQDLPGELDGKLRGLIESCWERDPHARPTFGLICHHLDFIRSSQPVVTNIYSSGIATAMRHIRAVPSMLRLFGGVKDQKNDVPPASCTWGDNEVQYDTLQQADSSILVRTSSAASMALLPEFVTIDPNQLKKGLLIGTGASAEVYEATWLGCKYAVKAFKSGTTIQTLQKELKFLIELHHPSIVRLMGLSVYSERRCLIVMEFMGGDLRHEIDRRMEFPRRKREDSGSVPVPFDLHDAVYIINKIALGMAYLHSRNVTHRDLKALNVLVPEHAGSIDVKITDFGVSELIDSSKRGSSGPVGTGYWRAPEVFSEAKLPYDLKAADVYSFGMTCFEVLTGEVPLLDQVDQGYVGRLAVINGLRPELPSDLMPNLKLLIQACWDGKPENRPKFAAICSELQKIQQGLRGSASACA